MTRPMLVLFTDYGLADPYVGQVKAVMADAAPDVPIIDLLHTVPDYNPHAGAHLLHALSHGLPEGAVIFCVIDPGVGGPRRALALEADGRWYIGPDNGLLSVVSARAAQRRLWQIDWRPERLADTFHGRDLFAPVAARIASNALPEGWLSPCAAMEVEFVADDLPRIIYIDHYGNAWTGLRAGLLGRNELLAVNGGVVRYARTFVEATKGEGFWHENSSGLVEIAANRASAASLFGLKVGDRVNLSGSPDSRLH